MSRLMIQADHQQAAVAARLAQLLDLDVTLVSSSDTRRDHEALLQTAAERFADVAGKMPALDTNWYAGSQRRYADSPLSLSWARR